MKHLRWLPLAFLAGTHGFAIFAPYATLMLALAHVIEKRRRKLVPRRIRSASDEPDVPPVAAPR
jgi:hypothetical protein